MRPLAVAASWGLIWGACSSPTDAPLVTSASPSSAPQASTTDAQSSATPGSAAAQPLDAAHARARASGKLVLVEVWAPWCAPCAVLRRDVFDERGRGALANAVEIVDLDLDREETAPFSERYGVLPLPSVLVLDPKDGSVLAQRSGLMSLADVEALVAAAKQNDDARAALAMARARRAAREPLDAAKQFAVVAAATNGATREEAIVAALDLYREASAPTLCVKLARDVAAPTAKPGAPSASGSGAPASGAGAPGFRLIVLQAHLLCALGLEEGAARAEEIAWLASEARSFEAEHAAGLSARSLADLPALASIVATERGDAKAARSHDEARLVAIDRAIGASTDPALAASFDADRTSTLLALGRESEALAALRARTTALPENYEVHGRLGTTLARLGKNGEAVEPLERAVALAYGAPKLIYMHRLADARLALGEKEAARALLRAAKAGWVALPESQRDPARAAAVDQALAAP